jgi:hypothetical protein
MSGHSLYGYQIPLQYYRFGRQKRKEVKMGNGKEKNQEKHLSGYYFTKRPGHCRIVLY